MGVSFGGSYIASSVQVGSGVITNTNLATPSTGPWNLVSTTTNSGAAANTMAVSGLDLETDKEYMGIARVLCGATGILCLGANGSSTTTDYYTSINGAANANVMNISGDHSSNGGITTIEFIMHKIAGIPAGAIGRHIHTYSTAANMKNNTFGWGQNGTTNITALNLYVDDGATVFGTGSTFSIWKKAW